MVQRPHASSVSRVKQKPKTGSKGRGRKRTYSIGESDRVDFLYSSPWVQQVGSARETNGRQMPGLKREVREKGGEGF